MPILYLLDEMKDNPKYHTILTEREKDKTATWIPIDDLGELIWLKVVHDVPERKEFYLISKRFWQVVDTVNQSTGVIKTSEELLSLSWIMTNWFRGKSAQRTEEQRLAALKAIMDISGWTDESMMSNVQYILGAIKQPQVADRKYSMLSDTLQHLLPFLQCAEKARMNLETEGNTNAI